MHSNSIALSLATHWLRQAPRVKPEQVEAILFQAIAVADAFTGAAIRFGLIDEPEDASSLESHAITPDNAPAE